MALNLKVPRGHRIPLRITIVKTLARQGITLLDANRMLQRLLLECSIVETLPGVSDADALIAELASADVTATVVEPALAK